MKVKCNKAQSTTEFFTLVGFGFLAAIIIVAIAANQIKELTDKKEYMLIKDLGSRLQKEVVIANYVEDGYKRNFTLPDELENSFDYFIITKNNSITINSSKTAFSARTPSVIGGFKKGENVVERIDGKIYINGGVGGGGDEGGGDSGQGGSSDGPLDEAASEMTANINSSLPNDWHGAKGGDDNIILKLFSDVSYDIYLHDFVLRWNDSSNRFKHFQHLTEANGWSKIKIYGDVNAPSPASGVFDDNGNPDANLKIPANEYTIVDDLHFTNKIKLPTVFNLTLNFNDSTSSTLAFTIK